MAISPKSIKLLWSKAAGLCSFPSCPMRLTAEGASESRPGYTIGEMAHIKGARPNANRYDPGQSQDERDDYSNLILLCPNHHTIIDAPENEAEYSVELLKRFKMEHEDYIRVRLIDDAVCETKHQVAKMVLPLLVQNHEVFITYGPHSDIARRNPHSDAYNTWLIERLSTIAPNNRRIESIVFRNIGLFEPEEQVIISKFQVHVRGYERWVNDCSTYEGVRRFPEEFDNLVKELANAGT